MSRTFASIMRGLKQAVRHAKGKRVAGMRLHVVPEIDVEEVRERTGTTQHVPRRSMSASGMKTRRALPAEQMRAEYDFDYSKADRGKYFKRLLKEGSNVVVLDRDVAKAFPDSAAVNKALRSVMKSRKPRRASRT